MIDVIPINTSKMEQSMIGTIKLLMKKSKDENHRKNADRLIGLHFDQPQALISLPNGQYVVTTNEAIHWDPIKDEQEGIEYMVGAILGNEDGSRSFPLSPVSRFSFSPSEIKNGKVECSLLESTPLVNWIKSFNSRIESNYRGLLKTLSENGVTIIEEDLNRKKGRIQWKLNNF